jgi:hypothetical protein
LPNVNTPNPKGALGGILDDFLLGNYCFCRQTTQMFEHPGKIFRLICVVAMLGTIADHFPAYFIHFVNTQ